MSFASLFAASALAGLALAAPAADVNAIPKGAFVVSQGGLKPYTPPQIQLAKAYAKYGATPPSHVIAAAQAAGTGTVVANPLAYDSEYLCPVTLGGTNGGSPINTNLDLDTGSADLWTFSTLQPSSQTSGHSPLYSPVSVNVLSGETWRISYGDGSGASGTVYADKVVVGGVTVTSQAVEAATSVSTQFQQNSASNGLLGLAFSSINTCTPQQQLTFFDTAINQGLPKPLFTADLKKGRAGAYTFGFIDTSRYTGAITYAAVDPSRGLWQFSSQGYAVGSGAATSQTITGIADTGTTLLLLPDSIVGAYYSQVSGARNSATYGGYVFSCSATLPSFTVYVNGATFTVPGSYLNYSPVNSAGTTCYGGLQSSDGVGINIFGDIFLKTVYAIFDKNNGSPRLGLASKSL